MILIVDTPVDLANFVDLNNLLNNRKGRSGNNRSVAALKWAKFDKMRPDEQLYVLAHGSPTALEGAHSRYTAWEFAEQLVKRGLPKIAEIVLLACSTGTTDKPSQYPAFCQALNVALFMQTQGKLNVPVIGFTDSAVTDQFADTRAIDPDRERKYKVQTDDINKRWEQKIEEWENTASHLPYDTEADLITGARIMAAKSKEFFAELYENNARTVKDSTASRLRWPPLPPGKSSKGVHP